MRILCFILGHKLERLLARLCQGIYRDCGEYHYQCTRCGYVESRTIEKLEALEASE
jgi:hypothetical protein